MTLRTHGQNRISKVKIDLLVVSSGCSLTKWIIDPVIGRSYSMNCLAGSTSNIVIYFPILFPILFTNYFASFFITIITLINVCVLHIHNRFCCHFSSQPPNIIKRDLFMLLFWLSFLCASFFPSLLCPIASSPLCALVAHRPTTDLSFQTAARILAASSVDALYVMRDLSQNFPTEAM